MNFIDANIENYCTQKSTLPSKDCMNIQKYTLENVAMSQMLCGKMEGSLLGFLTQSLNPDTILEVGTFTGYSALNFADFSHANSKIHTIDINQETSELAANFWQDSQNGHKIKAHVGEALTIMKSMEKGSIDLVFIDGDKENYLNYFNLALDLLSDRGVIIIDNCLWSGKVMRESSELATQTIQQLNQTIELRDDLVKTLLPIRDGIFLITKRKK